MEKGPSSSGYSYQEVRKHYTNLHHKRRTYVRYFSSGLEEVDAALRRVAAHRLVRSGVEVTPHRTRRLGPSSRGRVGRIQMECGEKEKKRFKKYLSAVESKACSGRFTRARFLISWEDSIKKKEKKERDELFDKELREQEELFRKLGSKRFDEFIRKGGRERKREMNAVSPVVNVFGRDEPVPQPKTVPVERAETPPRRQLWSVLHAPFHPARGEKGPSATPGRWVVLSWEHTPHDNKLLFYDQDGGSPFEPVTLDVKTP